MNSSKYLYLVGKGVYVGEFDKDQLAKGIDKKCVDFFKKKTGLRYVNTAIGKTEEKGKVLRVWVCNAEDFQV